jgi:CTP synthase
LDTQVLKYFGLPHEKKPDLKKWKAVLNAIDNPKGEVTIGLVGKYNNLEDAYKSLLEAIVHGGFANNIKTRVKWIDANVADEIDFKDVDAILVPGGFGERGAEGKIAAVKYARENNVPYFGICFGMQMAVIEFARSVCGIKNASTTEFGACDDAVVGLMTEWEQAGKKQKRSSKDDLGGTMRLGAYPCKIKKGTKAYEIYGAETISERHRHRYEVNINYAKKLEAKGLVFSGTSPDGVLPEIVEIKNHPWFVAVQFHPEFKSRPFEPHPLFVSFVKAAAAAQKTGSGKGDKKKIRRVA